MDYIVYSEIYTPANNRKKLSDFTPGLGPVEELKLRLASPAVRGVYTNNMLSNLYNHFGSKLLVGPKIKDKHLIINN